MKEHRSNFEHLWVVYLCTYVTLLIRFVTNMLKAATPSVRLWIALFMNCFCYCWYIFTAHDIQTNTQLNCTYKYTYKALPITGHECPEGQQMYLYSSLNLGAVWGGWSAPRWGRFTPGKDPIPIVQEAGWAPGSVWTDAENLTPTGIRSPDRPARSESLYRLHYPGPIIIHILTHSSLCMLDFMLLGRRRNFAEVARTTWKFERPWPVHLLAFVYMQTNFCGFCKIRSGCWREYQGLLHESVCYVVDCTCLVNEMYTVLGWLLRAWVYRMYTALSAFISLHAKVLGSEIWSLTVIKLSRFLNEQDCDITENELALIIVCIAVI